MKWDGSRCPIFLRVYINKESYKKETSWELKRLYIFNGW